MKTKKLLVLLLTFVMVFSFAACGGDRANSDEVIFRVGMPSGFDTFNFFTTESSYVYEWMNFCCDSLIAYDENYNPIPRLADSWEVSEDELSWTFHLHEGVTFSDGEPLTSADVKYTYENAVDSYMYSMYVGGIDSIECPDDYTVVFNCEEPKPNMLYQIVPIIPEHVWAEVDDLFSYEPDELIGSGPFIYSPQRSGNGSKAFVKNENYWGQVPNIDVLVFTEYDNYDAMAQALQIGEMDACVGLEKTQLDTLQGTSGIDASAFTSFGCEFLAYNLLDPITGDINVRHAIDYCFDKDLVVEMSYGGLADVAYGVISNEGYQYQPKEKREFNIEKANDILDKAGYVDTNGDGIREMNGKPLSIELTTASERSSWQSATVNMMITNCAKAGIEITWNPLEKTTMWDTCIDGSPDWQIVDLGKILARQGVVACADMGLFDDTDTYAYYQDAIRHSFKQRVAVYYMWQYFAGKDKIHFTSAMLDHSAQAYVAGIKLVGDGSISGRTAWVYEPYAKSFADAGSEENVCSEDYGICVCSDELLEDGIKTARENHIQLSMHAMGGRAIDRIIRRMESESKWTDDPDWPHLRLEHLTEPTEHAIDEAVKKGYWFSTQPIFQYSEIETYLKNMGLSRTSMDYPIRTMLERGVNLTLSTDAPATSWATPSDPLPNIKAAVTRIAYDGTDYSGCAASSSGADKSAGCEDISLKCSSPFDERIDIETAIYLYTRQAALLLGMEDMGWLVPDALADFIVLDRDILTVPAEDIDKIKILSTYIEGTAV